MQGKEKRWQNHFYEDVKKATGDVWVG